MVVTLGIFFFLVNAARAPRQMEKLGRGVVAIQQDGGKVFVGWRLLGDDPDGIAFNLYRSTASRAPVKLNREPITQATHFVDENVNLNQSNAYFVRPVLNGREQAASAPFILKATARDH
jgi:rhamnogalacturonan endolyase